MPKPETFDMSYASQVSMPFLMTLRSNHAACSVVEKALLRYYTRVQCTTDTECHTNRTNNINSHDKHCNS